MAEVRFTGFVQGYNPETGKGRNPETNQAGTVLNMTIAETHSKPDDNGGFINEGTTFWRCKLFGDLIQQWQSVPPRTRVEVIGKSKTREYQTDTGEKRYTTEVAVDFIRLIPKRNQGGYQNSQGQTPAQMQQNAANQNRAPQGNDPWAAQSGGNYDWGSAEQDPPF